jgi:hypothetical protein
VQIADLFAKLSLRPDKGSFNAGKKLLSGIKTAIGAIAVFQGVKFFGGIIADTIKLGDEMGALAEQTGIGIVALQELKFAADQSDVEFDQLTNGLKFLSKNSLAAADGNEEMRKKFKKLGVPLKNANGQLKTSEELLLDLADAFQEIPEAQRGARAMEVLGKSGATLVPLLNRGKEGIKTLREEAQRLGGIINEDDARRLGDLDNAFKKIKQQGKGLLQVFGLALLPFLEDIVLVVGKWLSKNKEIISGGIRKFIDGLVTVIGVLIDQFIKIRDVFQHLSDEGADFGMVASGVFDAILFVIKAIGTGIELVILGLQAWGEAMGTILGAAVVFLMNRWEDLKSAISAIVDFVTGIWSTFFDWINEKINAVLDRFREIRDAPGAFLDFITGDVESEAVQNMAQRDKERAARFAAMRAANAQTAVRPAGVPGQSTSTSTVNANIVVNAPQADPKAVAQEVKRQLDETWRAAEPALQ